MVVVQVMRRFNTEELSGFEEVVGALPIGKEPVMSDAVEARGVRDG